MFVVVALFNDILLSLICKLFLHLYLSNPLMNVFLISSLQPFNDPVNPHLLSVVHGLMRTAHTRVLGSITPNHKLNLNLNLNPLPQDQGQQP